MKNSPLLSILIPTIVGREERFTNLINKLKNGYECKDTKTVFANGDIWGWYYDFELPIEIIFYSDNKQMTIGEKREKLYKGCHGKYSIQVDDDDELAPNAIELILEAIKSNPEIPCITFRESCMMNGQYKSSNHSIRYFQWMDNQDGFDYVRSPFYKDVIRTDIAKSVPFEHIRYNEDERWAKAIYPLLTDEIHIDQELYYYIYEPKETHEERYGLNRRD